MTIFDSHAHYNDEAFGTREERLALLEEIKSAGVSYILNAGTNPDSSLESLDLAEHSPGVFASVGIHPEDLFHIEDKEAALSQIRALASHPKAVAIGEIGLDYHWHGDERELQKTWFDRQLTLAEELDLPVIIHDREAHGDCLEIALSHPGVTGVFHSFSGSIETARELIDHGWYLSVSGVVTFKNAARILGVVPTVPDDRLLIETDCPYLTPHPFRGKRNDSRYLTYTVEAVAALRGTTPKSIAALTLRNAARLFSKCGIPTSSV